MITESFRIGCSFVACQDRRNIKYSFTTELHQQAVSPATTINQQEHQQQPAQLQPPPQLAHPKQQQ